MIKNKKNSVKVTKSHNGSTNSLQKSVEVKQGDKRIVFPASPFLSNKSLIDLVRTSKLRIL